MIRKNINIGEYKFLIDYFDATQDDMNVQLKEFVMIRNFNIMNNIINDTDIYIMDVETWEEMSKEFDQSTDKYFPKITKTVFPISSNKKISFSDTPTDFNSNLSQLSLFKKENNEYKFGTDVYPLLDNNGNIKKIKCNTIRIYHPVIKKTLNYLISIDNYINNIHFYYLCKPNNLYELNSNTEIINNNQTYSEYIEIYFPNLDDLFRLNSNNDKEIYNIYFNENLNTIVSKKNEKFIDDIITSNEDVEKYTKFYSNNDNGFIVFQNQLVPLNLLLQPYRIVEDIDPFTGEMHNVKLYLKQYTSVENNYLTNPFNLTIFPYDEVDENTHQYLLLDNYTPSTVTYIIEHKFTIKSKLGFDKNNRISIISEFDYPNKELYLENNVDSNHALKSAYKYYYNVDEYNYKYYWVNKLRIDLPERINGLLENFKYVCKAEEFENIDNISEDEQLRRLIEQNYDGIYDELRDPETEEEFETGMDFIGFRIQIATDVKYQNLIYNQTFTIKLDDLDDFLFNINNLFDSWVEYPDYLIARTIFIDRIENIYISSNNVIINKEIFKYLINDKKYYTINILNKYNNMKELQLKNIDPKNIFNEYCDELDSILEENNLNIQEIHDINQEYKNKFNNECTPFNFINNINCIVNNETNEQYEVNNYNKGKIIFKPIFYRTQDLQNIRLRTGIKQKIGVNLVNYMTKVETFKLIIDGIEFIETGRNDIYVIFEINSAILTTSDGIYNITNQDDEYISSGNWILY